MIVERVSDSVLDQLLLAERDRLANEIAMLVAELQPVPEELRYAYMGVLGAMVR